MWNNIEVGLRKQDCGLLRACLHQEVLQKYKHETPKRHQGSPYQVEPKKYGIAAQEPIPPDTSRKADEREKKRTQQIVGSILYYARSVDSTALVSLSTIATKQAAATDKTIKSTEQLLN